MRLRGARGAVRHGPSRATTSAAIRSVAVSIPCVAGPYTSVSARLTQVANRYRASTAKRRRRGDAEGGVRGGRRQRHALRLQRRRDPVGRDHRRARTTPACSSSTSATTATCRSRAPARSAPGGSSCPTDVRQFDYSTISDVILHVRYTAREGGSSLEALADASLAEKLQEIAQELAQDRTARRRRPQARRFQRLA